MVRVSLPLRWCRLPRCRPLVRCCIIVRLSTVCTVQVLIKTAFSNYYMPLFCKLELPSSGAHRALTKTNWTTRNLGNELGNMGNLFGHPLDSFVESFTSLHSLVRAFTCLDHSLVGSFACSQQDQEEQFMLGTLIHHPGLTVGMFTCSE
mmetsp:Transcript_40/g.63  ORF Transcript_40/g.63 Transcript_40/m.63 type:complete len:149 (+) Transcript_40:1387-1833(+)